MSRLWGDGFDYYASGSDLALRYTTYASAALNTSALTPFALGQSVSGFQATKTWDTAGNEATVWFSLRLRYNSPVTPDFTGAYPRAEFKVTDGTNVQCTVQFEAQTGSIKIYSGDSTGGTLLGTYPSMFILNVWNSWQGQIVVNNTTGSVTLWKDGEPTTASVTLTGVNTRGSVSIVNYSTTGSFYASGPWAMDDLWVNNADGTAPTGHPPDVRAVMQYPASNTATTDFSANPSSVVYGQPTDTSVLSITANTLVGMPFTTAVGGTATAFNIELNVGFTGNIIGAIYDATGVGTGPGAKLMGSSVVNNPSSGTVTLTLTGTQTLTKNTKYWLCLLSDSTFAPKGQLSGSGATQASVAYSGGFPANALAGTGSINAPFAAMTISAFKWTLVNEPQEDGDTSYISSNTVGNEDLYNLTALPVTPTSILGVVPIVFWRKSDAGSRSGSLRLIANGSSDTDEGTIGLSATYTYKAPFLPLDPTGATWTTTNLNAAQIGVKVAA